MKKIQTIIMLLTLAICTSCKKDNTVDTASKMEKVISTHDALMTKMSVIGTLISKLNKSSDSIKNQTAVNELKASHEAMMTWMQGFGERFSYDDITNAQTLSIEKQQWLQEEEEKVNALKRKMEQSIKKAKQIIVH